MVDDGFRSSRAKVRAWSLVRVQVRPPFKSMRHHCFLRVRVVALEQRENWQDAEANDRENFERVEIGRGARLRLHRQVHPPQSLMARVGGAHASVEQITSEP